MINAQNVVVFDNAGIPSIMVKFNKCKNSDLFKGGSDVTHPMFIINDEEVDEIYISKYPNTIINGKAYSLPFMNPTTEITYEQAQEACFSKGEGWHLLTMPESAFLVLDSKRKDTLPHGNTNWGKYHADESESGEVSQYGKTLTGSGPTTWAHDHTENGVYDLCGNVWEFIAGMRLLNGEIQIIENNNAANPVDTSFESPLWKPVLFDGKPTRFDIIDDEIMLTTENSDDNDWTGCRWKELQVDIEVPEILKALSLYPADEKDGEAGLWVDNDGEVLPYRGGSYISTSNAGVSALYLSNPRTSTGTGIGFRSAFYRKAGN